jgi:hypothetical protein
MNTQKGTTVLLPVLLAGAGIAALALAIVLVPSMARRYAEGRPCPESAPVAAKPVALLPKPAPAPEVAPAPARAPAPAPAPAPVGDAKPVGAWSIELDPGSYALLGDGDAVIDAIVAVLARNPGAVVSLTGVNSPNKSSKRAKRAAEVVKERIVADVGVVARQVETTSTQDPAVDGLVVRAEIVGGGR